MVARTKPTQHLVDTYLHPGSEMEADDPTLSPRTSQVLTVSLSTVTPSVRCAGKTSRRLSPTSLSIS